LGGSQVTGVEIVQWVVSSGPRAAYRLQRWFLGLRAGTSVSDLDTSPRRQLLTFLALYVGVLATFATVTGVDSLHFDMTEMWAWGKEFQLGYDKHPPLSAWFVGLWFSIMPRANWAFHLLSSLNAALALAGVWMLAGLFLGPRGRLASVLLLVLTPSFSLWALKFNANIPLISAWPWTTYFFLRSLQTRQIGLSVLAGTLGAASLLTKYYSVVLFGTLFLTALFHPKGRRYFTSAAPYITLATGLCLITPHLVWATAAHFPTIDYAMSKTIFSAAETHFAAIKAVSVTIAALGVAATVYVMVFRQLAWPLVRRALAGTFERHNAWLVCLAYGPLALTIAAYLVGNVLINSAYLIPAFFALPIAFLVLSQADITRAVVRRLALYVAVIGPPTLMISPIFDYAKFATLDRSPRREVAVAATALWRDTFGQPLAYVSGDEILANAATFYSPDAPSYVGLGQLIPERIKRDGLVVICEATAEDCIAAATAILGEGRHLVREFAGHHLGRIGRMRQFVFILYGPALDKAAALTRPPERMAADGAWAT
jgi:Dolichyl-phosphate-mannose-protein mannosyltransferase